MGLDLSRLENVKKAAHGKSTARCPACAASGGDEKGTHLVIYPDGKYGCVANPEDKAHRKEIFALAGTRAGVGTPTKISVETFQIRDTHVVMDLGRFGRFSTALRQKTPKPQKPPPADTPPPLPVVVEAASNEKPLLPSPSPLVEVDRPSVPKPPPTVAGVCLAKGECRETVLCAERITVGSQNDAMSDEIAAFLAMI